jgi:MYXO-CTERM domain-containing protein
MKKVLLIAAILVSAVGAFAQGTVNFATAATGVNAPARDTTSGSPGVLASGSAYAAQLYVGPAGAAATSLTTNGVSGTIATFGTGGLAGYVTGGSRSIEGFAGGTTITAQVRAWATATGSSWETATTRGESITVQVTLASGNNQPPNLVGLQAYSISPVVPEPSSIALGLLGLGAVALIRRRK